MHCLGHEGTVGGLYPTNTGWDSLRRFLQPDSVPPTPVGARFLQRQAGRPHRPNRRMNSTRLLPRVPAKEPPIYKFLMGTAGIAIGSVVMWVLPYLLVPHPREFDGFVYLSAWMCGIPLAATIGV